MSSARIRYLIRRNGAFYWQPGRHVKALGFANEALGSDERAAVARARELNRQVDEERARLAPQPVDERTFHHLVKAYKSGDEWTHLADKTRRDYQHYIDVLLSIWGDLSPDGITPELVMDLRDRFADRPYSANHLLRVLSVLLTFACQRPSTFGVTDNPCRHVRKFGKRRGVKPRTQYWTADHETAFLEAAERADWEMFVAYHLLVYTGQRPGDVRRMKVTDDDGAKIRIVQQKTGAEVWIPVHSALRAALDRHAEKRKAQGRVGGTIVQGARGEAMTERYFGARWDAVARAAGIEGLQRRDLRRTAVVRLAEAGCTIPQIAAITGHSLATVTSILQVYLPTTFAQATAAIEKLENWRPGAKE